MILKYQNTREYSAWIKGNGDPMHWVCIPHSIYTSRMGTARAKQEEETDTGLMRQ